MQSFLKIIFEFEIFGPNSTDVVRGFTGLGIMNSAREVAKQKTDDFGKSYFFELGLNLKVGSKYLLLAKGR